MGSSDIEPFVRVAAQQQQRIILGLLANLLKIKKLTTTTAY
jgi:hypothetical protein